MGDDQRKRRATSVADHDRFAHPRAQTHPGTPVGIPPAPVPEHVEEFDEGPTPLPSNFEEAAAWQFVDRRIVALEAGVNGYTKQVDRQEVLIKQWSEAVQDCLIDIGQATQRLNNIESNAERDWDRITDSLDALTKAVNGFGDRIKQLESTVAHIGNAQTELAAKHLSLTERVMNLELEKRDRTVITAERRRWLSWGKAGYAVFVAAAGAAGYLVSQLNF